MSFNSISALFFKGVNVQPKLRQSQDVTIIGLESILLSCIITCFLISRNAYFLVFQQIRLEQEALRCDSEFSVKCASEGMHVMRNRYRDILPYDRNRVTLSESEENPNGYINASFISLPKGRTRFIAAQAPLPTTLEEWWKMVDEQKVLLIVMLCKLVEMNKVKCERYWPVEIGQSLLFGHYEISLDGVDTFADDEYLLRRLRMTNQKTGESRVIHQLHYKEWPDHGCPSGESQLINMIEKMAELHESSDSPVLVHCSAGVGRTGTIISVNYIRELIESAELESLDLFELVMSLRKQRASMVQTQDQYQFVHKCVAFYCRRHLGLPQPPTPSTCVLPRCEDITNSLSTMFAIGVI
ncbi:unnamed protein product [Heligmosomoides polygyrus]|uniref:protein-tyrosine-phosphatase n=1 Tax=Heligmosomoides polygyrus TaxID=6339 RepID=A0A183FIL6_HELPZ|nr:unnamed protein product [Heligmosomoides polygyrus]